MLCLVVLISRKICTNIYNISANYYHIFLPDPPGNHFSTLQVRFLEHELYVTMTIWFKKSSLSSRGRKGEANFVRFKLKSIHEEERAGDFTRPSLSLEVKR
ncbi:hypothetical protein QVD17_28556 [Tagetes erecta]|uniref:Uncharacterized protein n=1 Tax=Tagetes erecta TaxID=13708 RepID=A0AAD8NS79_TARER|nr:hypothetical protein QVD17_28556 [Tagetes erecta]